MPKVRLLSYAGGGRLFLNVAVFLLGGFISLTELAAASSKNAVATFRALPGQICIEDSHLRRGLTIIRKGGGAVDYISNGVCSDSTIAVPLGLEEWAITQLTKNGIDSAYRPRDKTWPTQVCIDKSQLKRGLKIIRKAGGSGRHIKQGDCGNLSSIMVPTGREDWTIDLLRKNRIAASGRPFMPFIVAGKIGLSDHELRMLLGAQNVKVSSAFLGDLDFQELADLRKNAQRNLKSRLNDKFDEVSFSPCQASEVDGALCWVVWLAGHISSSKGLPANCLQNKVSDRYWFSTTAEMWLGGFSTNETRFYVAVRSSKFARSPTSNKPENSAFHSIDSFEPIDPDVVNDLIANRLAELVRNSSQVPSCSN